LLEKIRHTSPQAELSRAERLDNLTGAYRVSDPESIRGKNIIVIDDVATTGSILREATRILKISGAREIIAFTIAH
jgi:predicted amidophosphoribosyltransferase